MLEAHHYTAAAKRKGSYALPEDYDGKVNETVLYHAVRAYLNNQRQGTASTKTRAEVAGGNQKPWRQKGTGRARQGTIRAAQWVGGGVVFGPKPRSYRTDLPKKVRRLARRSALNARATDGAIHVIEKIEFAEPKTRQLLALLGQMELVGKKVLFLTAELRPALYKSGRNIPHVHVMRYGDVSAYDVLWSDAVVIEEEAIDGHHVAGSERKTSAARTKRAEKAAKRPGTAKAKAAKKKAVKKAAKQAAKKATAKKATAKKAATKAAAKAGTAKKSASKAAKKSTKKAAPKKGGKDA